MRFRKGSLRRMTALVLAGVLCVSAVGCGKKGKKKKEEPMETYSVSVQAEFDGQISYAKLGNQKLYAICDPTRMSLAEDEKNAKTELISFDFQSKEMKKAEIGMAEDEYITNLYLNPDGNIHIMGQRLIFDFGDVPDSPEGPDAGEKQPSDGTSEGPDMENSQPSDDPSEGPSEGPDMENSQPSDGPSEGPDMENSQPSDDPSEGPDMENSQLSDGPSEGPDMENSQPSDDPSEGPDMENSQPSDEPEADGPMAPWEDADINYTVVKVQYLYNENLELISKEEEEFEIVSEDGENRMVSQAEYDPDGNLVKIIGGFGETRSIKVEDKEGNELQNINLGEKDVEELIRLSDGSLVVLIWGEDGDELYRLDQKEGKLGDPYSDDPAIHSGSSFYPGSDGSLLFEMDGYLAACDGKTGKVTKVLKFLDCDLNSDGISGLFAVDASTYAVFVNDYENEKAELDFLTKVDQDKVVKKKELRLLTMYLNDTLKTKILEFNKKNEEYRIVVNEFEGDMVHDEEGDYEAALQRFNAAVISDHVDLIDLSYLNVARYAQKGVLEDLLPRFNADPDLKIDQFLDNVVEANKIDGKLYQLPTSISIQLLAGAKSSLGKYGEKPGWSLSEFSEFVKSLPEGSEVFEDTTSDGLLNLMLQYGFEDFVDWNKGSCSFNSEDFINLLELCKNYQTMEEFYQKYDDYDISDWENEQSLFSKIRNHQVMMSELWLDDCEEYQKAKLVFGEEVVFKGYPTKNKNGIVMSSDGLLLGLAAKSKYKDIAFDFMKQFYTAGAQENEDETTGIPIRKEALDKRLKALQERELYTTPDGTEYYTEYYEDDDITFYIGNPTDEEIQEIKTLITEADTKMIETDENKIFSIIEEETESFFKKQKTAKEVADVIQSRVTIYINENK